MADIFLRKRLLLLPGYDVPSILLGLPDRLAGDLDTLSLFVTDIHGGEVHDLIRVSISVSLCDRY